jgi:hypothetical protein
MGGRRRPLNGVDLRRLLRHIELLPRQLKRRWESPIRAEESIELPLRFIEQQ